MNKHKRGAVNGNTVKNDTFPAPRQVGWRQCCTLNLDGVTRPAVVLDPFGGAMTTALAAERLGRDALCIELNGDYIAMGEERLARDRAKRAAAAEK